MRKYFKSSIANVRQWLKNKSQPENMCYVFGKKVMMGQ